MEQMLDLRNSKCYKIGEKNLVTRDNDFEMATGNVNGIMGYDSRIRIKGTNKVDSTKSPISTVSFVYSFWNNLIHRKPKNTICKEEQTGFADVYVKFKQEGFNGGKGKYYKNYTRADAAGKVDFICKNYSNFIGIVDGCTEGFAI